ncbi:MAG: hypothetical protein ABI602_03100 [Candidatus Saccharibacteria bacterium]
MQSSPSADHSRASDQFTQPEDLGQRFSTFVDQQIRAGYSLEVRAGASVDDYSERNSDPEVHYPARHGNVGAHYRTDGESRRVDVRHYVQDLARPGRLRTWRHSAYHSIGALLLVDEFFGQTNQSDSDRLIRREFSGGSQTLASLLGVAPFERGHIETDGGQKTLDYSTVGQAEFSALGQLLVGHEL